MLTRTADSSCVGLVTGPDVVFGRALILRGSGQCLDSQNGEGTGDATISNAFCRRTTIGRSTSPITRSRARQENVTKNAPVVVLLHGDKENRLIWEGEKGLASALQREGFAVITVDLRKHGQSTNVARSAGDSPAGGKNTEGTNVQSDDYSNMVEHDLPAVKKFIYEQNQLKHLNMNKMGIVAAETSAAVAVCFAGDDWSKAPYDDAPTDEGKTPRGQDVRALVLLSPPQKTRGLPFSEALTAVRNPDWNVAFLTLYGKLNKADSSRDRDAPETVRPHESQQGSHLSARL